MRLWLLAAGFLAFAVRADQLHVKVGVACTPDRMSVSMESAWNEDGERLFQAQRSPSSWDTRQLVEFALDDQGRYQVAARPKTVACTLGKRAYAVAIEPSLAPRFHPEGWCATRVGANVTIRAGTQVLVMGGTDACTEEGDVPTLIEVRRDGTIITERVPARTFLEPR